MAYQASSEAWGENISTNFIPVTLDGRKIAPAKEILHV